jgi:hypothetical protein
VEEVLESGEEFVGVLTGSHISQGRGQVMGNNDNMVLQVLWVARWVSIQCPSYCCAVVGHLDKWCRLSPTRKQQSSYFLCQI